MKMNAKVDDDLLDLIQNSDNTTDVRCKGWEFILRLTATVDGLTHLISSEKYIPFILSFVQQDTAEKEVIDLAYKCLISITNQERGSSALLDIKKDFVLYLFNNIDDAKFIEAKCYILSNISSHPATTNLIADDICSSENILCNLKKLFFSIESDERKKCDFLALVFANILRIPKYRRMILQEEGFIAGIYSCLNERESEVRRIGAALILRNSCFQLDLHDKLLNELNIIPSLLLPLMGPEEYEEEEMEKLPQECQYLEDSKERDKNAHVRRILVQALFMLCYSENGWNFVKSKGVYYVVRELHKWEKNSKVIEAIENLVAYLLVETYSLKSTDGSNAEESLILEQLETDFLNDLPDFVV